MIATPRTQLVDDQKSRRVVFICVNGILTNPGDAEGWTDRAVTWLNIHTGGKAEKFEYACGALTRRLRQEWRADAIARMAGFYITAGYEIVFVGHSNGCDLVARVLGKLWPVKIRGAHLFSAATDGEQLTHALNDGQLSTLYLYGSRNDKALWWAHWSKTLLGWLGLGYGDLGRRIGKFSKENNPSGAPSRVWAIEDDTQGHSSWFVRGEKFERTMRALLTNEFGENLLK